jgi:hypothetical protein
MSTMPAATFADRARFWMRAFDFPGRDAVSLCVAENMEPALAYGHGNRAKRRAEIARNAFERAEDERATADFAEAADLADPAQADEGREFLPTYL